MPMQAVGPGRPRKNPAVRHGNGTYEQIVDAAAELFSKHGFTATSVSQIADAVGVGQNSIYYHFGSKLGLLKRLLLEGVRPGLEIARALNEDGDTTKTGAAARLYTLALADAAVLANWRWNLGALYLLPEARSPELAEFQSHRYALRQHYVNMTQALTSWTGSWDVNDQVFRLVVSIINQRWDDEVTDETPRQLARSGLRICGWVGSVLPVEARAQELLADFRERQIALPPQLFSQELASSGGS